MIAKELVKIAKNLTADYYRDGIKQNVEPQELFKFQDFLGKNKFIHRASYADGFTTVIDQFEHVNAPVFIKINTYGYSTRKGDPDFEESYVQDFRDSRQIYHFDKIKIEINEKEFKISDLVTAKQAINFLIKVLKQNGYYEAIFQNGVSKVQFEKLSNYLREKMKFVEMPMSKDNRKNFRLETDHYQCDIILEFGKKINLSFVFVDKFERYFEDKEQYVNNIMTFNEGLKLITKWLRESIGFRETDLLDKLKQLKQFKKI